jgi:hypothetical protein
MKVKLEYTDTDALTVEEIIKNNKRIHGNTCSIKVLPESMLPHDLIQFALWQMTGAEQTALFFNEKELYQKKLTELRASILYKLEELLDDVLLENEDRITKE